MTPLETVVRGPDGVVVGTWCVIITALSRASSLQDS